MMIMAKIKICLDAGHYGKYNRSAVVPAFYESEFNWKFHLLLKKYLEEYGFEVTCTRKNQETDMDLYQRGRFAKGCDLFLSIHANWAARESADYPVAYVPINGSGDAIGRKLAQCVHEVMGTQEEAMIQSKKSTKGNWDWYGVIYGAAEVGVPGIILEHSFYSNKRSAQWLMDDSNLEKLAKAEAEVIASHYGLKKQEEAPKPEPPKQETKKTIYRVQTGAYGNRTYALKHLDKVKKAGFDAWMEVVDGMYKIYAGSFEVRKNAENRLKQVEKAGFSGFIVTHIVT